MTKRYNKRLIVLVSLLTLVVGTSFAYFVSKIIFNGASATGNTNMATFEDTTVKVTGEIEFNDPNIYPGHQNVSKIKLTATGDKFVTYSLNWTGTNTLANLRYTVYKSASSYEPSISCTKKEEKQDGSMLYFEECTNHNFDGLGEVYNDGEIVTGKNLNIKIAKDEDIQATKAGAVIYYYVVLEYLNLDEPQNNDTNGSFNGNININIRKRFDDNCGSACTAILANNEVRTDEIDINIGSAWIYYNDKAVYGIHLINNGVLGDHLQGFPNDANLYDVRMYNGDRYFGNASSYLFDDKITYDYLGEATWDGSTCTFNEKTVYSIASPSLAIIDNEYDCNKVFGQNIGTSYEKYYSFYQYELIGKSSELQNTNGMFEAEDDDGISYYFRGNIENNYVKFGKWQQDLKDFYIGSIYEDYSYISGYYNSLEECQNRYTYCKQIEETSVGEDMYWRIIRINGDGTIRMIYDGTAANKNESNVTNRNIGFSDFNSWEGDIDNAYVGYMYGTPRSLTYEETHANINDSSVKKFIDEWYKNNMLNTEYHQFIDVNAGFCGDRTVTSGSGIGTETTEYNNSSSTLKCWNINNDLYTINSSNKGNKALIYPIGMMTNDEAVFAGLAYTTPYNYLNAGLSYMLISAYKTNYIYSFNWSHFGSYASSNSPLKSIRPVRPVINLKADVKLSGSGTASDPYVIEGIN